jgi:TetR/AcrR family transcriptional regulator, repressor of fatR-cypB operon
MLESDPPAKREILRAALKLFSERGLAATTIRDIAAKSGYTNPALYKHFSSKEELALYLFETCHRRLWTRCHAAIAGIKTFEDRLERYVSQILTLVDEDPAAMAFLSENARVLWPKAGPAVRRQTMIALARSVMSAGAATQKGKRRPSINRDIAAASVQGTLAEVARMIQVGVLPGPAIRWKAPLVDLLRRGAAS